MDSLMIKVIGEHDKNNKEGGWQTPPTSKRGKGNVSSYDK